LILLEIHRSAPTPIFQQIHDWMQEQIESGKWPEHYKLPAETDLAAELCVNRGTVRKAIAHLISEGRLTTIHGRGTFVSSREIAQPLAERLVTFSEELLSQGIAFETRVLGSAVQHPGEQVASLLSLPPSGREFMLTRVRLVQDEPLALLRNHLRYDRCPGIEDIDFTVQRLFETLEGRYKLQLGWGQRSFEAQRANEQVAQTLGIRQGDPVMYLEQVVYLKDDSPVEFSEVWFRGDRFRLSAVVRRTQEHWAPGGSREIVSIPLRPERRTQSSDGA
jgi:DNA-binding GntR family transcriptional regulator